MTLVFQEDLSKCATVREFDAKSIVPMFGYRDEWHYYTYAPTVRRPPAPLRLCLSTHPATHWADVLPSPFPPFTLTETRPRAACCKTWAFRF